MVPKLHQGDTRGCCVILLPKQEDIFIGNFRFYKEGTRVNTDPGGHRKPQPQMYFSEHTVLSRVLSSRA